MIQGFEPQTQPLTDYEKNILLPLMVDGFNKKVGVENCITNGQICKSLKVNGYEKISEPRIRKLIFYIRTNNLVPRLIASSKGYWVATDIKELEDWLESVESRIKALYETRKYARMQITKWNHPPIKQGELDFGM